MIIDGLEFEPVPTAGLPSANTESMCKGCYFAPTGNYRECIAAVLKNNGCQPAMIKEGVPIEDILKWVWGLKTNPLTQLT